MKLDLKKVWRQKQEIGDTELKLQQKELELNKCKLVLHEQKSKQVDEAQQQTVTQIGQMQTLM